QEVARIARAQSLWIVYTMNETNPAGGPPFNTAVVLGSDGSIQGAYRKTHLYDAHGVRESDRMTAGNNLCVPICMPFCTLGLGICYDLRFPEVARNLALGGCDIMLFLAAWHDGPHKPLHWKTLLRARAIENECFVGGVCHAGPRYVGESHVFDPLGVTCATGSDDLLVCDIDPHAVSSARDAMPVLSHRRPSLYV
ncbi:MAG: nitrilase-related carbon-nitrogen hydrolase, partial [Atopobiaceae bacterium]|nr:nitrilase-related carbon-nitrogen hydrolase [Atopobiaceae bacterium]